MSLRSIACLCAALSFSPLTALPVGAEQAPLDIKIVNGRVLDGSGNAWFLADVGVRDGRIVEVGDLSDAAAKREVDATGLVVAPGFIDVHTHADGDVFDLPLATNFVRDGVTTIVTGNCGGSVLDVGEYLDRVDRDGVGVNVATLIGHNSVIREQKGSVAEQVTDEQLEAARARVRKAMEEGAVGMSTGLIYLPGLWSPTEEIIELQRVAAEYGGIYATHMRNEGTGIMAAIDEALRVGEETGSRVQISHFKLPAHAQRLLGNTATMEKVFAARARGMEVWVDQYPYTASSTGITTLLPDWVLENGGEAARKILQDEEQVARVRQEMAEGIVRSQRRLHLLPGCQCPRVPRVFRQAHPRDRHHAPGGPPGRARHHRGTDRHDHRHLPERRCRHGLPHHEGGRGGINHAFAAGLHRIR
jgi:N-acyl-D-amino-acid deacylase